MALNSSISNILGTKIPYWLWQQFKTRSNKTASEYRDAEVIKFITNKTAWVRLVSSIDIKDDDLAWFSKINPEISKPEDLAKQYVLFGGTSKYLGNNSYGFRSGLNGSYAMMGKEETQKYGYRPMPGITNVSVETQGKLGSVRAATINFKCWDKTQLDIIDALYFKLGFTMFLEWGQTYYFPSENSDTALGDAESAKTRPDPNKALSTELYSIDPFDERYRNNKELLFRTISQNNRITEGNYDAMLGMTTNFNFSMNQEGGYDCMLKIIGLGVLGDSIKVNHSSKLVNILEEQIKEYESTLKAINATPVSGSTRGVEEVVLQSKLFTYLYSGKGANNKVNEKVFMSADELTPSGVVIDAGEDGQFIHFSDSNRFMNLNTDTNGVSLILDTDYIKNRLISVGIDSSLQKVSIKRSLGWINDSPDNWTYSARYAPLVDRTNLVFPGYKNTYGTKSSSTVFDYSVNTSFKLKFNFKFKNEEKKVDLAELKNYTVGEKNLEQYISDTISKGGYTIKPNDTEFRITAYDLGIVEKDATGEITNPKVGDAYVKKVAYDTFYNFLRTNFSIGKKSDDVILSNTSVSLIRVGNGYNIPVFKVKAIIPVTVNSNINIEDVKEELTLVSGNPGFDIEKERGLIGPLFREGSGIIVNLKAVPITYYTTLEFEFTEAKFIKGFTTSAEIERRFLQPSSPSQPETPAAPQTADPSQTVNPFTYLSNIELMLRSTQVHSLVTALKKFGQKDPNSTEDTGTLLNRVVKVDLIGDDKQTGNKDFINQLFSNGVFTKDLKSLIDNQISDSLTNESDYFKVYAKYGFATKLMAYQAPIEKFTRVDYPALLNTYVLPHNVNQALESGLALNHPVYMQFGLFLMMLNHSCTLYDTEGKIPTPVVYIDFNPNHNFCLTSPIHLTVDPMVAVIPFEGSLSQYAKLFDRDIVLSDEQKYSIKPVSGSNDTTYLLRPRNVDNYFAKDRVSGALPAFIDNKSVNDNVNRGRIMNILINIDYIANTIKQYAKKDGENKVFLKPLLEQILTDVNKALGNFNVFRLAYNDVGNVFHIVDDQIVPVGDQNEQQPYTTVQPGDDPIEIPVFGKNSVAKSLEIKTEVSTRLSNMLAISANSQGKQGENSTDASPFGFINYNYSDRYITKRSELETTGSNSIDINGEIYTATQFNEAMLNFYSRGILDQNSISTATNYYIGKLTKNKAEDSPTRAAAMIPVSLNFTTDGISGLYMGQAFTVSREFLPYTYSIKKMFNNEPADNKVGFVITGVNHTIEGNVWNTAVKTNMIFLKSKSDYTTGSLAERKEEPLSSSPVQNTDSSVKDGKFAKYENGQIVGYESAQTIDGARVLDSVYPKVREMFDAAKKEGVNLQLESGFRTYDEQVVLRRSNVIDKTLEKNDSYILTANSEKFNPKTGKPGYSNHQNGIAFDIRVKSNPKSFYWLRDNAEKYGFVRTVPGERWHWEYRPGADKFSYVSQNDTTWGDYT